MGEDARGDDSVRDKADDQWRFFGPRLCAVIVELEVIPHPASCAEYSEEEECDCGIQAALRSLWPTVGADLDYGRVSDGHPLQLARNAGFARRYLASQAVQLRPHNTDGNDNA